jgi:MOSC domain-containing protein YiiM
MTAVVIALQTSPARGEHDSVARATLTAGAGLDGDRHAKPGSRRALLVMEQEVLNDFGLAPGIVREQITVRGLDLHHLAEGTRLRIGASTLEVGAHCAPCAYIESLRPGLRHALEGRRGRFVRVVEGGAIAVGDPIEVEPPR